MSSQENNISDQLVRLVQIIFGFVLAEGLGRYDEVILNPLSQENIIKFFAIISIYMTTILSWVDWHNTMQLRPYNFHTIQKRRIIEYLRLIFDVLIVCFYAFIIFSIRYFDSYRIYYNPKYFLGFLFIFIGYLISGKLRQASYGLIASKSRIIKIFLLIYLVLFLFYYLIYNLPIIVLTSGPTACYWLNIIFILTVLTTMILYRSIRSRISQKEKGIKQKGLKIGIDIDGVLANQIKGVTPRIKSLLKVDLDYDDIKEWNMKIGNSSIDKEIAFAMAYKDYVISMEPHPGAERITYALYKNQMIIIITARPIETEEWTKEWLAKEKIPYDIIKYVQESSKFSVATDILIDDYIGNILEFLRKTNGFAILVNQPWNKDRNDLMSYISNRRLFIANSLYDLPRLVNTINNIIVD